MGTRFGASFVVSNRRLREGVSKWALPIDKEMGYDISVRCARSMIQGE